jgi:tetratricopeptide (TPR) repeat protein
MGRTLGAMLSKPPGPPGRSPDMDAEGKIQQAMLAMEVEKNAEAVRLLQEVLASGSSPPRARELLKRAEAGVAKELALGYLRQARYQRQHGDFEVARAHFEKAIAIDSTAVDARHQLAEMLLEHRRDLGRALQLCREVIGLGGQRSKYFVTLGDILLLSKDKERAAAAFERALSLEPNSKDIKKRLKGCSE